MKIERKYHFYAAHRNKNADEKCGRIHGHTYDVECEFTFPTINEKSGVAMLFSDLDKVAEPIIKKYDHYLLLKDDDELVSLLGFANEPFIKLPFETSVENMCIWLFNEIKTGGLPITKITIAETKSSKVSYEPR